MRIHLASFLALVFGLLLVIGVLGCGVDPGTLGENGGNGNDESDDGFRETDRTDETETPSQDETSTPDEDVPENDDADDIGDIAVDDPTEDDDPTPDDDPSDDTGDEPTGFTNFGGRCEAAADCLYGDIDPSVVCLGGFDGGYCTIGCTTPADCGTTASCAMNFGGSQTYCGLSCAADADCGRTGELVCDLESPTPICVGPDHLSDDPTEDPWDDLWDEYYDDYYYDDTYSGAVGSYCYDDYDCAVDSFLDNRCFTDRQGWPDGYCAAYGCLSDTDCGPTGICAQSSNPEDLGLCLETCEAFCSRFDYECYLISDTEGVCLPPLPDPTYDPPNVGEPCTITDQCTMGNADAEAPYRICVPPEWDDGTAGLPDGYCTAVGCAGGDCGYNGACVVLPGEATDGSDDLQLCMESCLDPGTTSTCRDGYECFDVGDGLGVCWTSSE